MSPATAKVLDFVRSPAPLDDKLERIAHDVDGLEVLARQNAEAQRATGDAVGAIADALERGLRTQRDHGERLERIELGVLEALAIGRRAEGAARDAHASDVDLAATVERERAARAAQAEELRALVAPIVADASRRAGNAGATKTAGVLSVGVVVAALVKEPVETVKVLREIGPMGAAIAVVLLLVALAWARFRRS